MERKWTPEQQNAIDAKGGTLLISAAAGSGKTAVLVERVIKCLTDEKNPVPADRFLIVTFSNAAAAEMRGRIEERLFQKIQEDPKNLLFRRQKNLLAQASITTVHAFCLRLIRSHFQSLGLPPDFRIGEESELTTLREDAMKETLESFYKEGSLYFYQAVELFSKGRDDRGFQDFLWKFSAFLDNQPDPENWLKTQEKEYLVTSIYDSLFAKEILQYTKEAIEHAEKLCLNGKKLLLEDEILYSKLEGLFQSLENQISVIKESSLDSWNTTQKQIFDYQKIKFPSIRGYADDPIKEQVKQIKDQIDDIFVSKLKSKWQFSEQDFLDDMKIFHPIIKMIFTVLQTYRESYFLKKQENAVLDFSDLEHLTLALLNENGEKSALGFEISEKFEEVMVDEYQDTNEVQDRIFQLLSNNQQNLFMVGDVKQSIYGFRGAKPEIFARRRVEANQYDGNHFPAVITMQKNFRSRSEICKGINKIFESVLSQEVGGTSYNEEEKLVAGASFQEQKPPFVEAVFLEKGENGKEQEAEEIARKIAGMIDEHVLITDSETKTLRPCTWKDFAILLRSRSHASVYEKALQKYQIPVWSDLSKSFFSSKEILYILSFLRVLDNPLWEIELCSTMISPMFGFTLDEISDLRIAHPKKNLYIALQEEAKEGDPHCIRFVEVIGNLRQYASLNPVHELLEYMVMLTEFDLLVSAMPGGEGRRSNLYFLIEEARSFESTRGGGLSGFNRWMRKLLDEGKDIERVSAMPDGENVVQIMTMHRSKGLEYPIVFIGGLGNRFNKRDLSLFYLFDDELGFASKYKNPNSLQQYSTLPREAIVLRKSDALASEEMRIFYVALTRAKEYLYLYGTLSNFAKKLKTISTKIGQEERVDPFVVKDGSCYAEWVLMGLLAHSDSNKIRAEYGLPLTFSKEEGIWKITINPATEEISVQEEQKEDIETEVDLQKAKEVKAKLSYCYPYQAFTEKESKAAASQEAEKEETREGKNSEKWLKRPRFFKNRTLSPTERGNAFHTFMEFANFENVRKDPKKELERLCFEGYLSKEEADVIEIPKVQHFLSSNIGKRLLSTDEIWREMKFIIPIDHPENEADATMVQGIVDCVFIENKQVVIIDYKTDYGKEEQILRDRYALQLSIYKKAVEQIM